MFDPFIRAISQALAALYSLPVVGGSYGVAIILLTFSVMVLLMPLTLKATRSTIKMQHIQPELKRLQKEHKDDREVMNQELMKLYSENGINPVGGCLPMVAQLPVFLVLFQVLRGVTRRADQAPFFDAINQVRTLQGSAPLVGDEIEPRYLSTDTEMYQDLQGSTEMKFGPFDLASQAWDILQNDFVGALPYVLLIAFVVFTSYYQQRQVTARRSGDTPMPAQQQLLLRFLPLLSGFWSFLFPAGLVLYWATSNVFRIGQQAYITRQIYGKEAESGTNVPPGAKKIAEQKTSGDDVSDSNDSDASAKNSSKSGANKSNGKASKGAKANDASKAKKSGTDKAATNGGKSGAKGRNAEWQKLRAEKQAKAKKAEAASSRVTPKGTKSQPSKKKRKR